MNHNINFRTATAPRPTAPAPHSPQIDPPRLPATGDRNEDPRRPMRGWLVPAGLALVVGVTAVGVAIQTSNDAPVSDTPAETEEVITGSSADRPGDSAVTGWYTTRTYDEPATRIDTQIDPAADRPGDSAVSGWYTTRSYGEPVVLRDAADDRPGDSAVTAWSATRTYDEPAPRRASSGDRPGETAVVGWYTTRSYAEPAIENTAAPALPAVIVGQPVALPETVWCIPAGALGPNADLAPDSNGQRSSGVEILAELRERGPDASNPLPVNGRRSDGPEPICAAP